jgi:hypothetical protein
MDDGWQVGLHRLIQPQPAGPHLLNELMAVRDLLVEASSAGVRAVIGRPESSARPNAAECTGTPSRTTAMAAPGIPTASSCSRRKASTA